MSTQPSIMKAVVPQNPITLASKVLVKFMPNMPAIMAPRPAAKLPIERVSSSRFTCRNAISDNWFRQNMPTADEKLRDTQFHCISLQVSGHV